MGSLPRLVLASASPRRAELLWMLGLRFDVQPADLDETPERDEDPFDYVERLAKAKADEVAAPGTIVIAADTIVVLDGALLGKPTGAEDARRMLRSLSGRTHEVVTCVAVAIGDGTVASFTETTEVTFVELSERDIEWYVQTEEPLDKAGAYGIQGAGGLFVAAIAGNYHNVVGLPLTALADLLTYDDYDLLDWAR